MPRDTIQDIHAREILDSRGDPTIEVTVLTESGVTGTAAVPSGASTGKHEAFELRDGDRERYGGKGVLKAVGHVNVEIREALRGALASDQARVDQTMIDLDGSSNKRNLGANAILGVSLAAAHAAAAVAGVPLYQHFRQTFALGGIPLSLPQPMMNILNGGAHAENNLDVQEFMIVPHVVTGGRTDVAECVRVGSEVFHSLGRVLRERKLDTDVGNEGGYAPELASNQQGLDFLVQAIQEAGYKPGEQVSIALDVAASELFSQGRYRFEGKLLTSRDLVALYTRWTSAYPIVAIEDGLAQDDWEGWVELTRVLGGKVHVVGDDVFVTNTERLKLGFSFAAANAVIIKPNQVGTLSETVATARLAQEHSYTIIVSHRSGETMDTTIVDLAVAVGAPYLKTGSTSRGERVAKYNRLMGIAAELG